MTDDDDLTEQLADLIDHAATPIAFNDVTERARAASSRPRPARGRPTLAGVVLVLVLVAAASVVAVTARHHSAGPSVIAVTPNPTNSTGASTTAPTTSTTSVGSTYVHAMPAGEMGVIGPGSGWMLNGIALYRTDDDGAHWRDITPPAAVDQDPIARIATVDFLDLQHVWVTVALNHEPFTIWRSTNGGGTWQAVCRGNQCPGAAAESLLTFLDADHGWGIGKNNEVESTSDGGHTWTARGPIPNIGPLRFVNENDGWAVSDPSGYGGSSGLPTKPGGALYRTTDGGRTWQVVRLPTLISTEYTSVSYGVPQFFGNDGVVVGWLEPGAESGSHDRVAVYTTHDGGDSWTGRFAPADTHSDPYGNQPDLLAPEFPFSASSASDWMLFVGPNLYVTHDAGVAWSTIVTRTAVGRVYSLDATSATSAWALASVPVCDDPPTPSRPCMLETLVHTADGGQSWPAFYPH